MSLGWEDYRNRVKVGSDAAVKRYDWIEGKGGLFSTRVNRVDWTLEH